MKKENFYRCQLFAKPSSQTRLKGCSLAGPGEGCGMRHGAARGWPTRWCSGGNRWCHVPQTFWVLFISHSPSIWPSVGLLWLLTAPEKSCGNSCWCSASPAIFLSELGKDLAWLAGIFLVIWARPIIDGVIVLQTDVFFDWLWEPFRFKNYKIPLEDENLWNKNWKIYILSMKSILWLILCFSSHLEVAPLTFTLWTSTLFWTARTLRCIRHPSICIYPLLRAGWLSFRPAIPHLANLHST